MNTDTQTDNEKNKDKIEIRNFAIDLILRVVGIFLWFYIYASYVWFLGNEKNTIQILVPMALVIGFITILSPRKIFGAKYWRYVIGAFYILSFLLILLR